MHLGGWGINSPLFPWAVPSLLAAVQSVTSVTWLSSILSHNWEAACSLLRGPMAASYPWCHLSKAAHPWLPVTQHGTSARQFVHGYCVPKVSPPRMTGPQLPPIQGSLAGWCSEVVLMEHDARRASRTWETALLMNPKSWKWGGRHAKARVMHSALTLFPICFFFWSTRKTKHYKNVKLCEEKSKARKFKVNADSLTQVINSEACLKSGAEALAELSLVCVTGSVLAHPRGHRLTRSVNTWGEWGLTELRDWESLLRGKGRAIKRQISGEIG